MCSSQIPFSVGRLLGNVPIRPDKILMGKRNFASITVVTQYRNTAHLLQAAGGGGVTVKEINEDYFLFFFVARNALFTDTLSFDSLFASFHLLRLICLPIVFCPVY